MMVGHAASPVNTAVTACSLLPPTTPLTITLSAARAVLMSTPFPIQCASAHAAEPGHRAASAACGKLLGLALGGIANDHRRDLFGRIVDIALAVVTTVSLDQHFSTVTDLLL
jgi:hypothetical protein